MSDATNLALLLDGPLQSWGFASRFQRRTTGLHPSKSGVIGLVTAAMGLAKGSPEEAEWLPKVSALKMTSVAIPRNAAEVGGPLPVYRLEDYHTVLDTRRASGKRNRNAVITRRQYLLDARFGVILTGDRPVLKRVATALQDPIWGVWLGRKNCIPSAPVFVALCQSQDTAWKAILHVCKLSAHTLMGTFTTVTEAKDFTEVTDSINDQPVSFGDGTNSGLDKRRFAVRRVTVKPGIRSS
jgi:CRISPR system Cascade subunit CasD